MALRWPSLRFTHSHATHKPGADSSSMRGTVAINSGSSGALHGSGSLAGTAAIASTESGSIVHGGALVGTIAALSASSGTLRGAGVLLGTLAVLFSSSAAVSGASTWPGSYTCINTATGSGTHNYYLCDCQSGADSGCIAGSDGNNGTSSATPWQTFGKAVTTFNNTSLVTAGDTINFCKGGKWNASGSSTRMKNTNCTQGNPCVFRDYQASWGGSSKPYLQAAVGAAVFEFSEGGACNDDGGYAILNLHLHCSDSSSGNRGVYSYNDTDDVTVCGGEIEGCNVGVSVAGKISALGTGDGLSSRWTIANNNIHDNAGWGSLGSTPSWRELFNTFSNNGFSPHSNQEHNIYCSEQNTGDNYSDEQITGNDLTKSAYDGTTCFGTELVVHGNHTGLLINNNFIHEVAGHSNGGCYGIAVEPGYADPESFTDTIIRGNVIVNVGSVSIGGAAWLRGIVENNVIVQNNSQCTGSCGTTDILFPDTARGASDQAMSGVKIRNNSIYLGNQVIANGVAISVGSEGTGYELANNTVSVGGSDSSWNCFDYGLSASAYAAYSYLDYNSCYHPNTSGAEWENGTGTGVAAWRTASGKDTHSIEGSNPNYSNTAAAAPIDTTLSISGAPLRGAGDSTHGSSTDLPGATRANPPSIGAYE